MTPTVVVLVIGAVLTLIVVGAIRAHRLEQERLRGLQQLADELGLTFDPTHDQDHDDEYAQFGIFRRGHSRVAKNTLRGRLPLFGTACTVCAGDFRYKETRQSGKDRKTSTYRFSYVIVHPPWAVPPLVIRREGVFDRIAGAFGFDDIDFESEAFSRRFYVQSPDRRFAYDLLHPRMMEFLLAEQPPMLELERGALCLADGSRRWSPDEFRQQLAFLRRFADLWPRHLTRELET